MQLWRDELFHRPWNNMAYHLRKVFTCNYNIQNEVTIEPILIAVHQLPEVWQLYGYKLLNEIVRPSQTVFNCKDQNNQQWYACLRCCSNHNHVNLYALLYILVLSLQYILQIHCTCMFHIFHSLFLLICWLSTFFVVW